MTTFSTGLANPDDYTIGRGVVYFSEVNAGGFPVAFRDLGNSPNFSFAAEVENQEHQSSRAGLKVTDKKVNVAVSASITFDLDEFNLDNLAIWFLGNTDTFATTAGAVVGVQNIKLYTPDASRPELALGKWYDLYERDDFSSGAAYPGNAADVRAYNIAAAGFALDKTGSATPRTEGTDYEVDRVMGRVYLYDTAANRAYFPTGLETLDVDFTITAATIEQVSGLTQSEVSGALKFIQLNAANNSVQKEFQIHAVSLTPDGDNPLISDDFGVMSFSGSAERREAVDPDSPLVRIRTFDQ